jgi:hypothetical protein
VAIRYVGGLNKRLAFKQALPNIFRDVSLFVSTRTAKHVYLTRTDTIAEQFLVTAQ